jgi:putative ABC transport system substrate-binding protein
VTGSGLGRRRGRGIDHPRFTLLATLCLALVLLAAPLGVHAQPASVPRIGFLIGGSQGNTEFAEERGGHPGLAAFRQGLRGLGYVEGRNIAIEYRFAEGKLDRFPDLASELVRLHVDVIVAPGTAAALAARKATATIPIVLVLAGNPVGDGLIKSFARPAGMRPG